MVGHLIFKDIDQKFNEIKNNKTYKKIFTIGTTSNYNYPKNYYITPVRTGNEVLLFGVVVKNVEIAKKIAIHVDGKFDYIFIDAEKKIKTINYGRYDSGNIEKILADLNLRTPLFSYKPNDLTVSSVFNILRSELSSISGNTIGIIGMGNIGFKVALMCLESGNNISIYSSSLKHTKKISSILNYLKSDRIISKVKIKNNINQLISESDVIIGCSDKKNLIKINSQSLGIRKFGKLPILIDVGKNNFDLTQDTNILIDIKRPDIDFFLTNDIENLMKAKVLQKLPNKVTRNNITLVKKGISGNFGDILVDNPADPKVIYGICDNKGNLVPANLDLNDFKK